SLLPWNPQVNSTVWTIEPTASGIFLAGFFNEVAGASSSRIIKTNPTTGANLNWAGIESYFVKDLLVANGKLYAATQDGVRAFSEASGSLLWTSSGSGVRSISLSGSTLYAGGVFSTVDDQPRNQLAAFNANTGELLPWAPAADGTVNTVVSTPSGVYVGGFFETINGDPREGVAHVDATSGATLSWSPYLTGTIWALAAADSELLVAGAISSLATAERSGLAAFDAATGVPLDWDPGIVGGQVEALTAAGNTLYAGGAFTEVGGSQRERGAAFDAATGELLPWNPSATAQIDTIAANLNHVYLGGSFDAAGGEARSNFAEVDATTGDATSWNPANAGGAISALALRGDSLFVGGSFDSFGELGASRLAGFDIVDHFQYGWLPEPNAAPTSLAADDKSLYVGGAFTAIDGKTRNHLAEFSSTSLGLRPQVLNLTSNDHVSQLAIDGRDLVIGGAYPSDYWRQSVYSMARTTGQTFSWIRALGGYPLALSAPGDALWVGGNFTSVGSVPARGIAKFPSTLFSSDEYTPTDPAGPGLEQPVDCGASDDPELCCAESPSALGCYDECDLDACCGEFECCDEYECCYDECCEYDEYEEYEECEPTTPPTGGPTGGTNTTPKVTISEPIASGLVAKPLVLSGSSTGKLLRLAVHSDDVAAARIEIFNKRGKLIKRFDRILAPGLQVLKLQLSSKRHKRLSAGKYSVALSTADGETPRVEFKVKAGRR
ncbi:MAG: PQQ-binding-like beta-propeller repeat protein, partial [Solirubrobacterales bacterium]